MTEDSISVIPAPSGWSVRRRGAARAIRTFKRNERVLAIVFAARLSERMKLDLYVFTTDGQIEAKVPADA
jgi:hypothetical protein